MTALTIVEVLEYYDFPLVFHVDDEAGNLYLAASTAWWLGAPGKDGGNWALAAQNSPITESALFPEPGYTVEGPWNSRTLLNPRAKPSAWTSP